MQILKEHINQIKQFCRENKVKTLFAFGSVITDHFKKDSDIDLIVDIDSTDPMEYADYYFNLKNQLRQIFQREIDLLEQRAIKNPFLKKQINDTKVLVYGQ